MNTLISNIVHFFTLGFNYSYVIPGITAGVLIGLYFFARMGSAYNHFTHHKSSGKFTVVRVVVALVLFLICLCPWAPAFICVLFPLFFLCLGIDIVAWICGRVRAAIAKHKQKKIPAPDSMQEAASTRPRKFTRVMSRLYWTGSFLLIAYACYIGYSSYMFNHVVETNYTYTTNKVHNDLDIVYMSDIHFGAIKNAESLQRDVDRINSREQKPDLILLGGDIADERTSEEDLEACYEILSQLDSTYGTYMVYGNHDHQPYFMDYPFGERPYTDEELAEVVATSTVTPLEDQVIELDDVILVGRKDYGLEDADADKSESRMSLEELLAPYNTKNKFVIVMDHQPVEIEEAAQTNADLELCGHTHGGQLFPFGLLYPLMNAPYVWGQYLINKLTLIVSSGLTGWGWPLRNEGVAEIVDVHVIPQAAVETTGSVQVQ